MTYRIFCFPHTRGGVPIDADLIEKGGKFSPHTWGNPEVIL